MVKNGDVQKRRKRGQGSIIFEKGWYYFRIKIGSNTKKFFLNGKTYEEAEKEANCILAKVSIIKEAKCQEEIALFVGKTKKLLDSMEDNLSFTNSFDKFLKSPNYPPCSSLQLNIKKRIWSDFTEFCEKHHVYLLSAVTSEHLIEFRKLLLQTVSANSANKYIGMVKQILFVLGISRDKFAFVRKLPVKSNSMCFFNEAELDSVFRAIDGDMPLQITYRDEMKVLFRILAWSGLRMKDACLLEWKSLDLANGILHTNPYKTRHSSNENVIIPLHPDLLSMLKNLSPDKKYSPYVIPSVANRYRKNPSCIQHDIARTMNWALWPDKSDSKTRAPKAGKYGAHSFRHTFATFLLNNGVDAEVIMKLLGQKSLSVTRVYMHLRSETAKQIIAALPVFNK